MILRCLTSTPITSPWTHGKIRRQPAIYGRICGMTTGFGGSATVRRFPSSAPAPTLNGRASKPPLTANRGLSQDLRIHDVNRLAGCVGDYLIEDVAELQLVLVAGDISDM